MRRVILTVLVLVLTAGCSSGEPDRGSSARVSARPLSVDERLKLALLDAPTLSHAGLIPVNTGSRFSPTENTSRFIIPPKQCRRGFATDRHIDAQWQSSFTHSEAGTGTGEQSAAHYGSGAASAFDEIARDPFCGTTGALRTVPTPQLTGVTIRCGVPKEFYEILCVILARQESYLTALTVSDTSSDLVLKTTRVLAPYVRSALSGTPKRVKAVATTTSPAAPPTGSGPWTSAYARERFQSMEQGHDTAQCPEGIERMLAYTGADTVSTLRYYGSDCSDRSKIFRANLGFGHWPTSVRADVAELRVALAAEQKGYASIGRVTSVAQARTRLRSAKPAIVRTNRAIEAVTAGLGR